MIWINACFTVYLTPGCGAISTFQQTAQFFFFILWWKESIKALCTAGALRCLPHKTFDSPCFVSEKVTCAQCSRVSRALKTMSPLVTCLWNLNINTTCLEMSHRGVRRKKGKKKPLLASSRYDQSAAYAPQHGKQDGAEDQSELTLWFMKAELLMLTGFLKIIVVVNIHVKRETVIKWSHNRDQLPLRLGRQLTWSFEGMRGEKNEKGAKNCSSSC